MVTKVKDAFHNGKGRIVMRGKATIEEIRENREAIKATEIPYQVNKADMIQKTAGLVNEGRIIFLKLEMNLIEKVCVLCTK